MHGEEGSMAARVGLHMCMERKGVWLQEYGCKSMAARVGLQE